MKMMHKHRHWIAAVMVCFLTTAVAVTMADRNDNAKTATAKDARALSSVFREVTQDALPAIVSIQTRGKAAEVISGLDNLFDDENHPFREMFRNDPQLREFFRRLPQERRNRPAPRGMGSGFIIDEDGVIMTNNHVVREAEEVKVRLHDGREFLATDVKTDPRSDVAIIRIDSPKPLPTIPLGDSGNTEIGDWVLAMGSPFGLDGTVTAGIISAKSRGPGIAAREDFLQTDAAINPGNSGGPLLNIDGEVIGINTAISSRSGGYDGIGFAIPVNMARWVSQQLIKHGQVQRSYIGVSIQPVDEKLAHKFNAPFGQGAIVNQVMPDSPAENANLRAGDVILDLNGKPVTGPRNLQGIVERLSVGKSYPMTIIRDGKRKTLKVTMKAMPNDYALSQNDYVKPKQEPNPDSEQNYSELGIEIDELTPDVAQRLGLDKDAEGVVITDVDKDSPAGFGGLNTGMVIEKVDDTKILSPKDFKNAMKNASLKDGVLFLIRTRVGTRFVVIQSS